MPALARWGVTPDMVSWAGLGFAVACGACLAVGASHTLPPEGREPSSWWPVAAGFLLGFSALADLLDGDLARARGGVSRFGALLDSTLDRFGDAAILTGCAVHFAALGNVTYVLLACIGMTVTIQISYVKARSDNLSAPPPGRSAGYWQRGERMVALLVACFLGHVPAGLWMTAFFPVPTIWGRVREGRRRIEAEERGEPPPPPSDFLVRNSPFYLITCASLVLLLVVAPLLPLFRGDSDPLRALFSGG